MHDDEENEEEEKPVWGGKKQNYYGVDNGDFEQKSSDDESVEEEESEVVRLQKERAKFSTLDDYGLDDIWENENDEELTFEEISMKGNSTKRFPVGIDLADGTGTAYEEVKKDLSAWSKAEQMDVLYYSAPELVGLLLELNDAHEELERKVNPLLGKVKKGEVMLEGGMRYLEVKELLLLSYCQAITFYLLLKSEGQPVRDHPVLACLIEIKILLNKMKQLDGNLPSHFEEILNKYNWVAAVAKSVHDIAKVEIPESLKDNENQNDEVDVQSMKMLKVRAALEEKLKQKGVFSSITPKIDKPRKLLKPLNGKLESYDDFNDDTVNIEGAIHGLNNGRASRRLSQAMMIYLGEMILGKGGENMSFECLQELESSLRLKLEMKMPLFWMLGM
ncbi:protein THALLO-like [Pyrus communis]|uniref:protein THALLO-like n=1 Tax=Pyrus communis TaxID=23211 RepID=UPI0035C01529